MLTLTAMALSLALTADPGALQLEQPALQVPQTSAAATLGVPNLAPHTGVNLSAEAERGAAAVALVGLGIMGGAYVIGLVGLTAAAVVAAIVLYYVAASLLTAASRIGMADPVLDAVMPGFGVGGRSGTLQPALPGDSVAMPRFA